MLAENIWLLTTLLSFCVFNLSKANYKTYYLEDDCDGDHRPLRLAKTGPGSSAIIRLSRKDGFRPDIRCEIRIRPPFDEDDGNSSEEDTKRKWSDANYGLVLVVNNLKLRANQYGGCIDQLKVSLQRPGGFWTTELTTCSSNSSGWTTGSVAAAGRRDILVEFTAGNGYGTQDVLGYSFQLVVTAFAVRSVKGCPAKPSGESKTDWFGCFEKERCVWRGLTCDDLNNCGDDSDEWQADGAKCGINRQQAIIGVTVSLCCIAILAAIIIIFKIRKRKRSTRPSAPLLVPVANRNRTDPEREPLLQQDYGDSQPPPYDHQSQYPLPPPPAYRE